jgi:hypothetical protein
MADTDCKCCAITEWVAIMGGAAAELSCVLFLVREAGAGVRQGGEECFVLRPLYAVMYAPSGLLPCCYGQGIQCCTSAGSKRRQWALSTEH